MNFKWSFFIIFLSIIFEVDAKDLFAFDNVINCWIGVTVTVILLIFGCSMKKIWGRKTRDSVLRPSFRVVVDKTDSRNSNGNGSDGSGGSDDSDGSDSSDSSDSSDDGDDDD